MEINIGEEVEKYGPNIVVTPKSLSVNIPYGNVMIGSSTLPEGHLASLADIPNAKNIRIVSPKLFGQAYLDGEEVIVVGLNLEKERYLKVWWEISGELPEDGTNEALLGSKIMTAFNLDVGSVVTINNEEFNVVASLGETGSNDDYTVFLPLRRTQRLLGMIGEISLIDIGALCFDCPVEEISQQIMDVIPDARASPVKQAVETRMKAVEQAANFSLMLGSVVLIAGCASVMNTMASSVHQKKRELGVLMSLGADDIFIYKIFLFDSVILGAVGGILGSLFGVVSSLLLGPFILSLPIRLKDIPLQSIPTSFVISVLACLVASLYPTWRATKIDPVSVLKAI